MVWLYVGALRFRTSAVLAASALALATAPAAPTLAQPDVPAAPRAGPPRVLGADLWRGARIGMSQDDVAHLFPDANGVSGELLANGGRAALRLSAPFADSKANIQFYFDAQGGLQSIIADVPDVTAHRTEQNLARAHALADQLTARYGAPTSCAERPGLTALTCTWIFGEAKAILSYRDVGGASPSLSVAYRKQKDVAPWAPRAVRRLKSR